MRKTLIVLALSFSPFAFAQVSNPSIVPVAVNPDGQACSVQIPIKLSTPDGTLHTCQNGVYGSVAGGGPNFNVPITVPELLVSKTFTVTPQTIRGIVGAFAGLSTSNGSAFMDIFPVGYNPYGAGIRFEDGATDTNSPAIELGLTADGLTSQHIRFYSQKTGTFINVFDLYSQSGAMIYAALGDGWRLGQPGLAGCYEEAYASRFCYDAPNTNTIVHAGGSVVAAGEGIGFSSGVLPGTTYWGLFDHNGNFGVGGQKANALLDSFSVTPAGAVTETSSKVGTGTVLTRYARYNGAFSPVAVAANTCAAQSFTVTGVVTGDILIGVNKPTEQAGLSVTPGHVTGTDAATLNFCDNTASPITPTPGETYNLVVVQ